MQTVGKNMTAGSPLKHILALSLPLLIVCHPVLAFLHRKFTL